MANKGLKEYTKQISQTIGDVAKVSVNINKEDANMHIIVPIMNTLGPNPLDISIIYNYQDRNVQRRFGKGFKLSTFKDISLGINKLSVQDADGSCITYTLDENGYSSQETPLKVTKETGHVPTGRVYNIYHFQDQIGNKMHCDQNHNYYPTSIEYKNGFKTTFNGTDMDNNQGAKISFTKGSNSLYCRAIYSQNDVTMYFVDFDYDDTQRLTSVKYYKENKLVKHLSITYTDTEIKVKDEILKDYVVYTFVSNRVEKIQEVINDQSDIVLTTSIQYNDGKTIITDNDGKNVYVYFNDNNLPLYVIDDGNVVKTEYDSATKKLTKKSSLIPVKNKLNTLATPSISEFLKKGSVTVRYVQVGDPVLSGVLGPVNKVSGSGMLLYSLPLIGLGGDKITAVIWGRQLTGYTKDDSVIAKLVVAGAVTIDTFKKTTPDGYFDIITLGVTTTKSYSSIALNITLTGNASIEIGGIQILKKDFGTTYQYDENGNMIAKESGQGTVANTYNSAGLQESIIGMDSTLYNFDYDDKGNMTKATTAFGAKIENTYDPHNNLTISTVSNIEGTKKLETTKTYDSNGSNIMSETDELGNTTSYEYDSFGKIKKVTDALNVTTEYSYDAFDNLTKILFNNSISVNYIYDSQNNLKTAILPNGTKYSFGYDESNNLNSVSMNGTQIVTFEYEQKTGLIRKQKYGSSSDSFDFIYNTEHNISQIKVNGVLKYQYLYDEHDRLIQVKNVSGTILKSYTYNNDGQVISTSENESSINYTYDNLGYVSQKNRSLDSKTIYESFDSISRSKGVSPDNLIGYLQGNNDFFGTLFNGNGMIISLSYGCKPYNYKTKEESSLSYKRINRIPSVYCCLENPISYNPPKADSNVKNSGCIAFWFYPTDASRIRYLFSLGDSVGFNHLAVYMDTLGKLVLEIKPSRVSKTKTLNSCVILNQWNFFGLNFKYQDDGNGNLSIFFYELYLNDDCMKEKIIGEAINVDSSLYHIGYEFNLAGYHELGCNITALMIGKRLPITSQQMHEYYRTTKDYIISSSYLEKDSVDFSITSVHNLSETMLHQFEIYPLHNDVNSLSGKTPIAFDIRRISDTDKDRTFHYNNQIKRYAYVAEEGRLEYVLNDISTDGTIMMRAFIRYDAEKQYFLELKDSNGRKLGLYRGSDHYIYIQNETSSIKTSLHFTTKVWHTIGISFKATASSGSVSTLDTETIRLYLDGQIYSTDLPSVTFKTFTLSIGKLFDSVLVNDPNMKDYQTYYPLLGQIEMLATRAAYCEVSTLNTLSNELMDTTRIHEYDELGMLQNVEIRKADQEILSKKIQYQKRNNDKSYISKYIRKETISFGSTTVDRIYGIDALGNVTAISDAMFGSYRYTYDARGFLTKDNNTEYTYDSNGNITKAGTTTFTYDSTIKDRLKSVNGKEITYGSNPLNPASWNGNTYEFEGRRLVKYNNIEYTYNDEGLRTSKKLNNNTIQYYYDGDKLITEVSPRYRLDFLYDINGQLYGFIYNSNKKYFYIRDYLQDILGIVDTDSNLVVKYEYTAYGIIKATTGTLATTIGRYNPFRYKGYYYDEETGLYLVTSRYYNPEWCRFLNADSIEYLDPSSINGMNLYAYCNNDPVNKIDPSGHFAISFGIAALIGITLASSLIGGTVQLVSNALAGATGSELWRGVAGAALGTGVNALALCLAMPTGGASIFIAAGASALVQTGVDTIETLIRGEEVGWETLLDLGLNFGATLLGNYIGGKLVPTNSGWFKPQKFLSVFLKPYGQKILLQSAIGAGISGVVNFIRKFDWGGFKPNPSMPASLYPNPLITFN